MREGSPRDETYSKGVLKELSEAISGSHQRSSAYSKGVLKESSEAISGSHQRTRRAY